MSRVLRRVIARAVECKHKGTTILNVRKINTAEKNILTSVYKTLQPANCSINDFLWMNLDRWPDKTATECAFTGRSYTYVQTYKMSMSFAASLRTKLKLQSDDTVAIVLPNLPEYPTVVLGILQAGCIASPLNPVYNADELKRHLDMVDCKAVVVSKLSCQNIMSALTALKRNIPVILVEDEDLPEGCIRFSDFTDPSVDTSCLKSVRRSPDDVALIPFSSGTTGWPKGVVLTHRNLVSLNQMIAYPEIVAVKETTETQQSVLPAVLPFFHIFGMSILMMNQMHLGCKLVTLPVFKPDTFLQVLVEQRADCLFLVPPMAVFLGKHPAVTAKHLAHVRSIVCGAAPLSEADAAAIVEKNSSVTVRQGFGLTETSGALSIGRNNENNPATVGYILPSCEAKIVDLTTGLALGPDQEGEIWFRGPVRMRGYYCDADADAEALAEGGWLRTGDVGRYDAHRRLYVTDRLKELIKVKGFQVPPAELEAVLRTHPTVLDCAVIGVPDSVCGELPKAFIVPQPGQTPTAEEIKQYVNSRVTSYKNIHQVQLVESIPKNAAGKILRKDLKVKYC